jgi:hypothetical protein
MNDNTEKDIPVYTTNQDDASAPTSESSIPSELSDVEIASIAGGISVTMGPNPPMGPLVVNGPITGNPPRMLN